MHKRSKIWIYLVMMCVGSMLVVNCKKDNSGDNPTTVTDKDGNVYHTVTIGTQVWMIENLRTTKYNDGTSIPLVTDQTAWGALTTPGYCNYNNTTNADTINTYGRLYNWYVVSTGKLSPAGWHVPTEADWNTLIAYLGGNNVAGGKLKETGITHWNSPNTGADNSSSFVAVPGGSRYYVAFRNMGTYGYYWSSSNSNSTFAYDCLVGATYSNAYMDLDDYGNGYSVRCIKDN